MVSLPLGQSGKVATVVTEDSHTYGQGQREASRRGTETHQAERQETVVDEALI